MHVERIAPQLLANPTSDPETTKAQPRAAFVEQFQKLGEPIPEWLRPQAAEEFLKRAKAGSD